MTAQVQNTPVSCIWKTTPSLGLVGCSGVSSWSQEWEWANASGHTMVLQAHPTQPSNNQAGYDAGTHLDQTVVLGSAPAVASGNLTSNSPCTLTQGQTTCAVNISAEVQNTPVSCLWRTTPSLAKVGCYAQSAWSVNWPHTNTSGQNMALKAHAAMPPNNQSGYQSGTLLDQINVVAIEPVVPSGHLTSDSPCTLVQGQSTCAVNLSVSVQNTPVSCVWKTTPSLAKVACYAQPSWTTVWPHANTSGQNMELRAHTSVPANTQSGFQSGTFLAQHHVFAEAPNPPQPVIDLPIGVNYHSYGPNFNQDSFITQYHKEEVRKEVRNQLRQMVNKGVKSIFLRLYIVRPNDDPSNEPFRMVFPPSNDELTNLATFARDVAETTGAQREKLQLDIGFIWQGSADYLIGSVQTGLGYANFSSEEFSSRVVSTYTRVIEKLQNIRYPRAFERVLKSVYFDAEVLYDPNPQNQRRINENWFIKTHFNAFAEFAKNKGFRPSLYFLPGVMDSVVFDDDYVDAEYPVLNGHRSMFWPYRSLKFMQDNGLYIPERIDFSIYSRTDDVLKFAPMIDRLLDDADATLSTLGIPSRYGAAEAFYFDDVTARMCTVDALNLQASNWRNFRLEAAWLWTTPYRGDGSYIDGTEVGFPPFVDDYSLPFLAYPDPCNQ